MCTEWAPPFGHVLLFKWDQVVPFSYFAPKVCKQPFFDLTAMTSSESFKEKWRLKPEVATRGVLKREVFLKFLQISQENNCGGIYF